MEKFVPTPVEASKLQQRFVNTVGLWNGIAAVSLHRIAVPGVASLVWMGIVVVEWHCNGALVFLRGVHGA